VDIPGPVPNDLIKGGSEDEQREVVVLSEERDSCGTLLVQMFDWEGLASD